MGMMLACLTGCANGVLTLRADLTQITRSARLEGVRFAVEQVNDLRVADDLGEHRDGLARVHQFNWRASRPPAAVVHSVMEHVLVAQGATLVAMEGHADYRVRVDIVELDITTDGPLAGEHTFGRVVLHVSLFNTSDGQLLYRKRYEDFPVKDGSADAGLLGDAIAIAVSEAVNEFPVAHHR